MTSKNLFRSLLGPELALVFLIACSPFGASAAPLALAPAAVSDVQCSDPKKLRMLCMYVGGMSEDPEPRGRYRYKYQRKLFEAACVDLEKDSEATIAAKVSRVWRQYEDSLTCDNSRFDVVNGNLLKYAVNIKFDVFLYDVVDWKVNLNRVDSSDNRTVLDYVEYQMRINKGNASFRILESYYALLRKAGAKHQREL